MQFQKYFVILIIIIMGQIEWRDAGYNSQEAIRCGKQLPRTLNIALLKCTLECCSHQNWWTDKVFSLYPHWNWDGGGVRLLFVRKLKKTKCFNFGKTPLICSVQRSPKHKQTVLCRTWSSHKHGIVGLASVDPDRFWLDSTRLYINHLKIDIFSSRVRISILGYVRENTPVCLLSTRELKEVRK